MSKKKRSKIRSAKKWVANLSQRTKSIAIVAVVTLLIIGGLITGLVMLANQTKQPESPDAPVATAEQKAKRDANVLMARRDGAVRDAAEKAVAQGDTAKATQVYDEAIQNEKETARKVQLYVDQSGVLYAAGKYDDALKAAKAGEAITDDKYLIADWLSRIYEDQKQYTLAAQYYTLAGVWAKSPTNKTALTKSYYDGEAARVTVLAGKR